jgi:hypothetical protein
MVDTNVGTIKALTIYCSIDWDHHRSASRGVIPTSPGSLVCSIVEFSGYTPTDRNPPPWFCKLAVVVGTPAFAGTEPVSPASNSFFGPLSPSHTPPQICFV